MKIDVLSSDPAHPVRPFLESWAAKHGRGHTVSVVDTANQCEGGDLLFMVSCVQMVSSKVRARYARALVVHASDLPKGRGWSPLIWQVLEGRDVITLSMFEAVDEVDAGPIIKKASFRLRGDELVDEINQRLFETELYLMDFAVEHYDTLRPVEQPMDGISYYPKRTPEDSRLDPEKSIVQQFDLMRVADPTRYPCFFDLRGCRYRVSIEKWAR